MKLATGIAALFLTVVAGIHSVLIFNAYYLFGLDNYLITGVAAALVTLLFLFGGSFAFQLPNISSGLFAFAFFISCLAGIAYGTIMFVWAIISIILAFMSEKEAKKMTAEQAQNRV